MCINEETSWTTLILGTVINAYLVKDLYRNKIYLPIFIILLWQYALLMQIPDAIAWRNIKNGNTTSKEGRLAFFLNVTQPIVLFLFILPFVKNYYMLILALVVLCIYINNIYVNYNDINYETKPHDKCSSLNFKWWEVIDPKLYFLSMTLFFILIPDIKIAFLNILLFYSSFIVSYTIDYTCNPSSLWCWSIASCGLINYLMAKRI